MMSEKKDAADAVAIPIYVVEPYDFALSQRAVRSFEPVPLQWDSRLCPATKIVGTPTLIEVSQSSGPKSKLTASSAPESDSSHLRRIVEWVLFSELDLAR